MAKHHGYYRELGIKIPDDLEPEQWGYYIVCAPLGLEWYTAVHSAIRLLARGRFWKRDSRESSIKSAQIIGGEIERSLMSCAIDLQGLIDAITLLAENGAIQQTNTQTVTCGGGGCGSPNLLDEPLNWPEDEPIPLFEEPYSLDETTLTAQQICSVANYLADSWTDTFATIDSYWEALGVGIDTASAWLSEKFPPGMIIPFLAFVISQAAVLLETVLLGNLAGNMAEAAAFYHDQIVCAVATSTSPETARRNFLSVLANVREEYGKTPYALMRVVASALDWDKIMGGDVEVPSEYDSASCPCGASDVRIASFNNSAIEEVTDIHVGQEVTVTAHRFDTYGPYGDWRFYDSEGAELDLVATDYQITATNGWQQHNLPDHPFTIQTFDKGHTVYILDLAINQPINVPYTFQRPGSPATFGSFQIASDVGTAGFQVTIKRLA